MPFDEASGSAIAYDYSKTRADGTVVEADFTGGKQGNCIKFDGNGHCDINKNFFPIEDDFTLMAWVKPSAFPIDSTGKKIGFFVCWEAINGYSEKWFDIQADTWGHWAIVKENLTISVYLNSKLVYTIDLPMQPNGFALIQDIYSTKYGYGCIDELKVYNIALTQDEIKNTTVEAIRLIYSIDGTDFKAWDIYVSESSGLLDRPKMKTPVSVDWPDYHGEIVDLENKILQPREITLNCFMKANGKVDFVTKLNDFLNVFSRPNTQRLMVDIHPTKPLLYEVYNESGVAVNKRWNDDLMVGTFTLKLKEPDPVKRIVKHRRLDNDTKKLTITLTSKKAVTIFWGDGTQTNDVYGTGVTTSHEYTSDGIFYAVVAGVIEEIESFTTNGIIVWNKL